MGPFEFIILFFSFIYTLALTHIFFAATRMIRHRRSLVFSWPHALWMGVALMLLLANWIELWDFHETKALSIGVIGVGFLTVAVQYFISALVSPDFEDGERYDLRAFHAREGRTYMAGVLALCLLSLAVNLGAAAKVGVTNWASQNALVLLCIPFIIAPIFIRARWFQVLAPAILIALVAVVLGRYYPVLR